VATTAFDDVDGGVLELETTLRNDGSDTAYTVGLTYRLIDLLPFGDPADSAWDRLALEEGSWPVFQYHVSAAAEIPIGGEATVHATLRPYIPCSRYGNYRVEVTGADWRDRADNVAATAKGSCTIPVKASTQEFPLPLAGVKAGRYRLQVMLRKAGGDLLHRDGTAHVHGIGEMRVEETAVGRGDPCDTDPTTAILHAQVRNAGEIVESGTIRASVLDEEGRRLVSFSQEFKDAAPGSRLDFEAEWESGQLSEKHRALLGCLFMGGKCPGSACAGDIHDDGKQDISDAINLLGFLFLGEREPVPCR
jgi:hypothetical protein